MSGGVKKRGALGTWPQRLPEAKAAAKGRSGALGKRGPHSTADGARTSDRGRAGNPGDMAGTGSGRNGGFPEGKHIRSERKNRSLESLQQRGGG